MKVFIYNYIIRNEINFIKGGQEIYLDHLKSEFKRNLISCRLITEKSFFNRNSFGINLRNFNSEKIVIILNGNKALYKEALKKRIPNSKIIYIQHSSYLDMQEGIIKMIIRLFLLKILLLRVNKVIRVSKKTLPKFFAPKKIETIYSGVPTPKKIVNYSNLKHSSKVFELLMVGNINKNKNQELAIRLLAELSNIRLTLVGSGSEMNNLRKKYSHLINNGKLAFEGIKRNTEKYFLNSHALLILSKYEGIPLVLYEAMSYGLPTITTNAGGIDEIIIHKKNGILLKETKLYLLKLYVQEFCNNDILYESISKNSRKDFKKKYTKHKMFKNIYNLINKL